MRFKTEYNKIKRTAENILALISWFSLTCFGYYYF